MARKHEMPAFLLEKNVDPDAYERWLGRKASAHVRRDRGRNQSGVGHAAYKDAIHAAVVLSAGQDAYTGEQLDWGLISTYRNEESRNGRHAYKKGFSLLPTVDHVATGASAASFRICGWRTNDAKSDLSLAEFLALCQNVLKHAGFSVTEGKHIEFSCPAAIPESDERDL